jgi:hypothetical protein
VAGNGEQTGSWERNRAEQCWWRKGNGGGSPLATPTHGDKAAAHLGGGDRLDCLHRAVSTVTGEMAGARDRVSGVPG